MPDRPTESEHAVLRSYLLGELTPPGGMEVEDRFIADPAYFAAYQEVERKLIHDYAARIMERSEAQLFERNYLVTGDRWRRVTMVRALLAVQSEQQTWRVGPVPVRKLIPALALLSIIIIALLWSHRRSTPGPPGEVPSAVRNPAPANAPQRAEPSPVEKIGPSPAPPNKMEAEAHPAVQVPPSSGSATPQPGSNSSLKPSLAPEQHTAESTAPNPAQQPTESPSPPPAPTVATAEPPASEALSTEGPATEAPAAEGEVAPPPEPSPSPAPGTLPSPVSVPPTVAANATPASIQEQVQSNYQPFVKTGTDSTGMVIVAKGKLLTIQKDAVMGVPPENTTKGCVSTFENGDLQPPGKGCAGGRKWGSKMAGLGLGKLPGRAGSAASNVNTDRSSTQFFKSGDKVYVKSIAVDQNNGIVSFFVMACDTCNKTDPPTNHIAQVNFKFNKTLTAGDVLNIEDTIGQVFTIDSSSDAQQGQGAQGDQSQGQAQGGQGQGQAAAGPATVATPAGPTMNNDDVIKLVQAKMSDSIIIKQIKNSSGNFDTSADGLVRLKQAGVSEAVIDAMVEKQ
jgi:hypothetical protein